MYINNLLYIKKVSVKIVFLINNVKLLIFYVFKHILKY